MAEKDTLLLQKNSAGIFEEVVIPEVGGESPIELITNKGQADGYAPLNSSIKIDAEYLPSYVDDIEEYDDFASLPGTGESGKIYISLDDGKTFRWSGSAYVEISNVDQDARNAAAAAQATADEVLAGNVKGFLVSYYYAVYDFFEGSSVVFNDAQHDFDPFPDWNENLRIRSIGSPETLSLIIVGSTTDTNLYFTPMPSLKTLTANVGFGQYDFTHYWTPSTVLFPNLETLTFRGGLGGAYLGVGTGGLPKVKTLTMVDAGSASNCQFSNSGGLALCESLTFATCAESGNFTFGTTAMPELMALAFNGCAEGGSFNLTSPQQPKLTALSFNNCGGWGFNCTTTAIFTSPNLTGISFYYCAVNTTFSIVDTSTVIPEAKALLLMTALNSAPETLGDGADRILTIKVSGTSTLTTIKATMEANDWIVTLST